MKKFFTLAAAALIVTSSANAAIMIDGYIDAGYSGIEGDVAQGPVQASTSMNGFQNGGVAGGATMAQAQFNVNEVNLDISADLSDRMRVFSSWDATNANGYALTADYAYIEWAQPAGFDINIRLGMVPSIVGVEQRVAESNLNDFANLSLVSPYTVGSVEGLTVSGTWSPINWALQVSNDDVSGGASIAGVRADMRNPTNANATTGADNEPSRNIAGRIGIVPLEGLELGISAWTNRIRASATGGAAQQDAERTGFGGDLGYTYGALKVGGEYYRIDEGNIATGAADDDAKAWYVYATYDVTDAVTLGARYTENDVKVGGVAANTVNSEASTISLLGKYNLTRDVAVKAQYDINDEDEIAGPITPTNQEADNDAFMVSVVASF